jgi:hypothetical protein
MFLELKDLFYKKENRIYLFLVLWLLIGYTLFSFPTSFTLWLGFLIFPPVLGICTVLLIATLFERKELGQVSYKRIIIYFIFGVFFAILFTGIWQLIVGFLYRAGILSFIFITSVFYMYGCYKYGIKTEESAHNLNSPLNQITRMLMFIGGTAISILIMFLLTRIGINWATKNPEINDSLALIAVIILYLIIFLAAMGVITLFSGKLNAWLGVFLIFASFYTAYLMVSAFFTASASSNETIMRFWTRTALYLFDIALILYTVSTILGEKSEVITKKLKLAKSDSIIMWLIMSKTAFELAKVADPRIRAELLNATVGFILFIPLLIIAGVYGIWNYSKVPRVKESKPQEEVI